MKQKSQQTQTTPDRNLKWIMFRMVLKINQNNFMRKQTNICMFIISMIINMLIFVSSPYIGLLSNSTTQPNETIIIVLFSIMGIILFQFILCIIYKLQFYLGIQFKLIRYIIFPLGILYFLKMGNGLGISLAIVMIVVVMAMTIVFQSESYSTNLLHQQRLPMSSYFVINQVLFYILQFTTSRKQIMLISSLMTISAFIIKGNFYLHSLNDHLQHKLLAINSFLYCVYSIVIFFSTLANNTQTKVMLIFIVPLIVYYIIAELIKQKTVPITFKNIFTADTLTFEQFLIYAEYLIEQAQQFNQTVHSNFCDSLMFTFYSQHQRYCLKPTCKFFTQNWKEEFKNSSDPKTVKKLTQKVIKKLEMLFEEVHKNQPDNMELKISFIKFYISTLPNKIRVLELISQFQNMNLTLVFEYQVFQLKNLSDKMDNVEVIDNLKTDDEVNQFQRIAYLTISSMMEFWMHFTQEKIDLRKVINTSQRLLNYKNQMQLQWEKNKNQQKYSTLKIALLYSHYLKYVLHDHYKADYLLFSAKALQEKLFHKKEVKYLSFGSESALIGASLTDENLGKIVIANNQASNIFGYSKNEISKIRLNEIMPKTYAQQHDYYLLEFHKNKYKRINSDQRLLYGKDKQGYLIPIMLQLQRTISSISEQLLFIANIKKFKVRQTPLICITDQQGQITDISSGFKEIFYQKKDKNRRHAEIATKNIQQIIPTFFQKSEPQDCGNYKFFQKYCTQKYGQLPIQFTVIPISFPLKHNGGFIVTGIRETPVLNLSLNYLSLTKQIDYRMSKIQYEGNRNIYNMTKNRYEIDSHKRFLVSQRNSKKDFYTIPFINIHDMTSVFAFTKQESNFADKIRTVRLTPGGALIRVDDNTTFQSEDMSQTEKVNRFDFKLKQWKYQYLHNKSNLLFISLSRIFIILVVCALGLIWIIQLNMLATETSNRQILLQQVKFRFQVRGYLSEYILSFNGLDSNFNNSYFLNKTYTVRDQLVDVIQGSSIDQTKKQPMLKTVYLREEANLKNLITSDTLFFSILDAANVTDIMNLWIGYMVILSLLIICQIIIKCLHSQKIYGVFHVFLGVDQKLIRKSYESCHKFSQMLQQKDGQQKKQHSKSEQFDEQNQNPVSRMKKYKQDSKIDFFTYLKYFLSLGLIIISCVIIYVMIRVDVQSFNNEIQIFNCVQSLFPQSSIALMNSYFKSYKQQNIFIQETFNKTYQLMDSKILEYQTMNSYQLPATFFDTLMNNACLTTLNSQSETYITLCPIIQQSIFVTGVDKVSNYLASSIQNINTNIQADPQIDQKFFSLFQLQYDFYVPIVQNISSLIHNQMADQVSNFQQKYKIWMGVITLIIVINSFYIYQILLNQIKYEIELVKELLYLIPDSFIQDKQSKAKKKTSRTLHLLKNSVQEDQ